MFTCGHLLICFALLIVCMEWKKWKINSAIANFIALSDWPVIGYFDLRVWKCGTEAIRRLRRQMLDVHGPRLPIRFWFGYKLFVFTTDPDDVQTILTSPKCLNKPSELSVIYPNSLLLIPAEQWKIDRQLLQPCFSTKCLNNCLPIIDATARELCAQLKTMQSNDELFANLGTAVVNELTAVLYNSDYKLTVAEGHEIYKVVWQLECGARERCNKWWYSSNIIYRLSAGYRKDKQLYQVLNRFLAKARHQETVKLEALPPENVPRSSSRELNVLTRVFALLHERKFSAARASDNLDLFFMAGLLTTVSTIHMTLVMLAIHPAYQDKVVDELRSEFETSGDTVTLAKYANLIYIEMVIRETMRLYPPGPLISRITTDSVQLKHGIIPSKTIVSISIDAVSRDKKYWGENADEFDPERFCPDLIADVHPYSRLNFSRGPRSCIGYQLGMRVAKIFLAHILRHFRIKTSLKLHDIKYIKGITAQFANKDAIQLELRQF